MPASIHAPLLRRDQQRNKVDLPRPVRPVRIAIDVVRDAVLANAPFRARPAPRQFIRPDRSQRLESSDCQCGRGVTPSADRLRHRRRSQVTEAVAGRRSCGQLLLVPADLRTIIPAPASADPVSSGNSGCVSSSGARIGPGVAAVLLKPLQPPALGLTAFTGRVVNQLPSGGAT